MKERTIYNCHVHLFTAKNVPRDFLRFDPSIPFPTLLSALLRWKPLARFLLRITEGKTGGAWASLRRHARFIDTGNHTQKDIFRRIQKQYPTETVFVALPMDMTFMRVGALNESIKVQHEKLLELADDKEFRGKIIPFFAVDPRQDKITDCVRQNLQPGKFRGVKIYPNMGFYPTDKNLMELYAICEELDAPVMTHCSAGGTWARGLDLAAREHLSHPGNYEIILRKFPNLRLCLAHFGSTGEWVKHLKSESEHEGPGRAWVRWIMDLIASDCYPNLYTDISYTLFEPREAGLYFDFFDYLKVLLSNPLVRDHVLYGSDYYVVERAPLSEKEVSITMRSRLGEDLYFQIAHHNPKRYLGLPPAPARRTANRGRAGASRKKECARFKIVIPGGSGQVGTLLARELHRTGHEIVVLSRNPQPAPWRTLEWDAETLGAWTKEIEGADAVINLAGRSVNCRYTSANRRAIMDSRVRSTRAVGQAIAQASRPPRVWVQASTATIYAHRYDAPNDEATGILGGSEPGAPNTWNFSIDVVKAWERAASQTATPKTRKVLMRSAMIMSPDRGGVFDILLRLVRFGLGGNVGDGRQYVSWIHDGDFLRAVLWLIEHDELEGAVNLASPNPLPYFDFMRGLRAAWGIPFGLFATEWMLEIAAFFLRTESELVLKSRRVIPTRLRQSGFEFKFPIWEEASRDLCVRWRAG